MLKLMLVDDMEINIREIKRLSLWKEETGFVIAAEAQNGYEALERLVKNPVDIVITDIRMPKIDGLELLRRITADKLCSCVILLSDYSDFNYARQGLVSGAFDYMVKPVDEEELRRVLNRAREFIISKKIEQDRMQQLENSLTQKLEEYLPRAELNQLVMLLKSKDARIKEYAEHMVDVLHARLEYDLIKTEGILNSIMHEVVEELQASYGWLQKYIIRKELEIIHFASPLDLALLREVFVSKIDSLAALLKKLDCGIEENRVLEQICKCVLNNIDSGISLSTVSDMIFMNKNHISETFKQKTGISFTEYLTIAKMERAKKLIAEGRLKNYELAEMLGFKDIEYFSRLFKKYIGCTPTEYRNSVMN